MIIDVLNVLNSKKDKPAEKQQVFVSGNFDQTSNTLYVSCNDKAGIPAIAKWDSVKGKWMPLEKVLAFWDEHKKLKKLLAEINKPVTHSEGRKK